eukprot:TRINITY_DN76819_c0_g1_i1.p1 TRINITY_DN76819_c0_g1~~TRINITY_DN76819_c0_g1_i1.p1  ORF type:complete len:363 (-),score=66.15 TRINITY_DN76819_c0_g1_i1:109-1197(-)
MVPTLPSSPPEEVEELDPFQFRPGDSVITIRRRIQKLRKEQHDQTVAEKRLLQEAPKSRLFAQPSAISVAELSDMVDQVPAAPPASGGDTPFVEAELGVDDAPRETGGRRKLQVERFHRDMIRKEVWRQKFDFLFRQMQRGVEAEIVADRNNGKSTQSGAGSFSEEAPANDQAPVEGSERGREVGPTARENSLRDSTQQREVTSSGDHDFKDSKSASGLSSSDAGLPWLVPSDLEAQHAQKKMPATMSQVGWRRTGGRPKSGFRTRPNTSVTHLPQKMRPGVAAKPKQEPSTGIGGLLRSSKSLPLIQATPGLLEVREEYYGGDELFMHEDVLHASNPHLFPLRVGHGKPFPLMNLDSLANL